MLAEVTDEERREAERLAPEWFGKDGEQLFIQGFGAACDAKRAEIDLCERVFLNACKETEAERVRSATLAEDLGAWLELDDNKDELLLVRALQNYEAGRE